MRSLYAVSLAGLRRFTLVSKRILSDKRVKRPRRSSVGSMNARDKDLVYLSGLFASGHLLMVKVGDAVPAEGVEGGG